LCWTACVANTALRNSAGVRHRRELVLHLVEGVLEAGKRRLAGDTARAATSGEVKDLRREAQALKEVVAEQALELRLLKKSMIGDGEARNEVSGFRKAGDHPAGRAIPSASAPDAGKARRLPRHFLPMVRPPPDRRAGSPGRSISQAGPRLESHP